MEGKNSIGNRIKHLRESNGYTQKKLATKLGLKGETAIANYEAGYSIPKDEVKLKMCEIFNCTLDYLMCKSDDKKFKADTDSLSNKLFLIPVLKNIYCDNSLFQEENIDFYLPIAPNMYHISSPGKCFFFKISEEGINKLVKSGSYVLIQIQNSAQDEDIILTLANNNKKTMLRKYKKLNKQFVMLEPISEDSSFQSITIDLKKETFEIIGKVIGDFKSWI